MQFLASSSSVLFFSLGRNFLQRKAEGRRLRVSIKTLVLGIKPSQKKMFFETQGAFKTASLLQSHTFKRGFLLPPASCLLPSENARLNWFRRQLHFENPVSDAPNNRKRKGGTITPFGFRSGDLVKAEKAGRVCIGWIGGYTQTAKNKNVSVYDHNWRRLGQFNPTKVLLIKRSTRLCVAS